MSTSSLGYLSISEEVDLRNEYVLKNAKTYIKAYYLWDNRSLLSLSRKERVEWWESLDEYVKKKDPTFTWISKIIQRLQSFSETEYCSKRQPITFECDI